MECLLILKTRQINVKGRNPKIVIAYVNGALYMGEHVDYNYDAAIMIYPSGDNYFSISMTSDFADLFQQ